MSIIVLSGSDDDVTGGGDTRHIIAGVDENDLLVGGAGSDTFVLGPDHDANTNLDFAEGEGRIDLSALASAPSFSSMFSYYRQPSVHDNL